VCVQLIAVNGAKLASLSSQASSAFIPKHVAKQFIV
jgi:hypothetical protein